MLKKRLTALVSAATMIMGTTGAFAMNANAESFKEYKFNYVEPVFGYTTEEDQANYDPIADFQNTHYINGEVDAFLETMEEMFPLNENTQFILETEQELWRLNKRIQTELYGEDIYVNTDAYEKTYPTGIVKTTIGLADCTEPAIRTYYILENYMGCEKVLMWGPYLHEFVNHAWDSSEMFSAQKDLIMTEEEFQKYQDMTSEEQYVYKANFYKEHGDYVVIPTYYYYEEDKERFKEYFEAESLSLDPSAKVLSNEENKVLGDANCDGSVTIADAVAIQQYLSNAEKYPLSEQGIINADFDGNGLTALDALEIQKMDAAKTIS